MPLKSELFAGDPDLENCLVSDSAHLTPGTRKACASKVQQGLGLVLLHNDKVTIPDGELYPGFYGTETTKAVVKFKTKHQILNHLGKIDNIVGKNTIRILDSLLPQRRIAPVAPPASTSRLPLDILVRFDGATEGFGSQNFKEETEIRNAFNLPIYHATHQPIEPVCYLGGHNAKDPAAKAVERVIGLRRKTPKGVTILIGASVGGLDYLC